MKSSNIKTGSRFQKFKKQLEKLALKKKIEPTPIIHVEHFEISTLRQINISSQTSSTKPTRQSYLKSQTIDTSNEYSECQAFSQINQSEIIQQKRHHQDSKQLQILISAQEELAGELHFISSEINDTLQTVYHLRKEIESFALLKSNIIQNDKNLLELQKITQLKKKQYEIEVRLLYEERQCLHFQNVQLSKQTQNLQDQLLELKLKYAKKANQEITVESKAYYETLHKDVKILNQECAKIDKRIEEFSDIRQFSAQTFRRYAEVFSAVLVGKEIAKEMQKIQNRMNKNKIGNQIEKRKRMLQDKKIEVSLRQKTLFDLTKQQKYLVQEIKKIAKQIYKSSIEKENSIFGQEQEYFDHQD